MDTNNFQNKLHMCIEHQTNDLHMRPMTGSSGRTTDLHNSAQLQSGFAQSDEVEGFLSLKGDF